MILSKGWWKVPWSIPCWMWGWPNTRANYHPTNRGVNRRADYTQLRQPVHLCQQHPGEVWVRWAVVHWWRMHQGQCNILEANLISGDFSLQGFYCMSAEEFPDPADALVYDGCEIKCADDEILLADPRNGGSWNCAPASAQTDSKILLCPGKFNTGGCWSNKLSDNVISFVRMHLYRRPGGVSNWSVRVWRSA